MSWTEDAIHRWLARAPRPRVLAGSAGHDAAVLRAFRGALVACADQVVLGVHVREGEAPARIGRKAVARAVSDLAATAARPRAVLCTIAAQRTLSSAWLRGVLRGVASEARRHGAELVGGDLSVTRSGAVIAITALGELAVRTRAPGRDRARPGELVCVTGALGGSLLGRHLRIEPRVAWGIALARAGASALLDVSDGLAWDLHRLARAAGVAIEIELARVPVHADARRLARRTRREPWDHALHDGEDHELVATLAPRALERARVSLSQERARTSVGLHEIGRVSRGRGLTLLHADGRRERWQPRRGGWKHGA